MKLRRYSLPFDGDLEERGVLLVEPDDPEELVQLSTDDAEAMEDLLIEADAVVDAIAPALTFGWVARWII
jgi:hypothetical protein